MSAPIDAARILRRLGACEEAIQWLQRRSRSVAPEQRKASLAWTECERGDWMAWLLAEGDLVPVPGAESVCGCEMSCCGGPFKVRADCIRAAYPWPVVREALLKRLRERGLL